jgi:hypothetical protein
MAAVRAEKVEGAMSEPRPFHRLFELSFSDFFAGSDVSVEPEMDLSRKQQFLDLVLIRKGPGPLPRPLPDGFEDLAAHSLVTFKSHKEALVPWALYELIAHWVNYRKQCSPTMQDLLPEGDFRLFAVCVRHPHNLAQLAELRPVRAGVYEVRWLTLCFRVIVVHELPQAEHNAMLHLFSAKEELLRYAKEHYRPRSRETSTLLYELFKTYQEDPDMANQLEEFVRQSIDELLKKLPPEKRLEGLSPEQRLEGLSPEELRAALEAVQRRLQANGPSKPQ